MLVESLAADGADPYFRQWAWDLDGALDVGAFGRAWQHVVDRHPILRTHFAWEGLPHPVQVVSRAYPVTMERWDCRSTPEAERGRLARPAHGRGDASAGVALDGAPPLRLVVVRTGDRGHRFVWNTHHVLIDGWSRTLILDEVFTAYRALVADGRPPELPAPVPFRDFVAWLDRAPDDAAAYWAGAFEGFAGPTALPLSAGAEPTGSMGVADHVPDAGLTAAWRATARRYGVTAGTVAQAAWALLLATHSGQADVAFGVTVAGRSIDLPGVEGIAGMLINTIPERTVIDPARGVGEWLRSLHDRHVARQPHEHHALTDIHRWAGPRRAGACSTRGSCSRAPRAGGDGGEPAVTEVTEMGSEVEYPLVLAVCGGDDAAVQLRYDRGCYDEPAALRLLAEYVRLLGALSGAEPETRLDALVSLPEPGRAARPEPVAGTAEPRRPARTAPRTPDEHALAGIWSEILGVTDIRVHDDFFDLGGDSILVFRVVTRAREAGLRLTVRQALRQRTIAELAASLRRARAAPEPERAPSRPATCRSPRSCAASPRRTSTTTTTTRPCCCPGTRRRTPACSTRALRAVVAHHEALRFRLGRDGGALAPDGRRGRRRRPPARRRPRRRARRRSRRRRTRGRRRGQRGHGPGRRAAGARGALPATRTAHGCSSRSTTSPSTRSPGRSCWTTSPRRTGGSPRASRGRGFPRPVPPTGAGRRGSPSTRRPTGSPRSRRSGSPRGRRRPDLPVDRADGANTQGGQRELETVAVGRGDRGAPAGRARRSSAAGSTRCCSAPSRTR